MRIVFLGTGSGWPTKKRNVSSISLEINGHVLLLDCGEGTQRQLLYAPVSFMKIERILISHFHGDHTLGIPGLVQSMALAGREKALHIVGPEGTEALVDKLLSLGDFKRTFDIKGVSLRPGETIEEEDYIIRAVAAEHNIPALAYSIEERERAGRFDREKAISLGIPPGPMFGRLQRGESITVNGKTVSPEDVMGPSRKGRKVVYSGDTRPCKSVIELADGADVLIHEATFSEGMKEKAAEFWHSTARQAAEVAKNAGAGVLFITHISPRYEDGTILLEEAKKVFPESHLAEDFTEFQVPLQE